MPTDLLVVGAGGFGRETLDVLAAINRVAVTYRVLGVVDDGPRDDWHYTFVPHGG